MYTIVMRDDKSLRITEKATLYQREKSIDKIQFLIPKTYEGTDISGFTATLKYVEQGNVAHMEILTLTEDEEYPEYSKYILPVDTNMNQFSGDIKLRITLSKIDLDSRTQYVLHTGEVIITILPLEDYYAFVTDESLEKIDQIIGTIDTKIEALKKIAEIYDEEKADNIVRQKDGKIQLTSNGVLIGNSVSINGIDGLDLVEF